MIHFIITLIVGGVAGWLAGKIMNSEGSTLRNIILGLVGGAVGCIVFGLIGLGATGWIGSLITSVVGACILIWLGRMIFKN